MDGHAIKDVTYGGLRELINNRRFYYHSTIGPQYSHFTEEGQQAVLNHVELMAWKIIEADNLELDLRAKNMVLDQLSSKN